MRDFSCKSTCSALLYTVFYNYMFNTFEDWYRHFVNMSITTLVFTAIALLIVNVETTTECTEVTERRIAIWRPSYRWSWGSGRTRTESGLRSMHCVNLHSLLTHVQCYSDVSWPWHVPLGFVPTPFFHWAIRNPYRLINNHVALILYPWNGVSEMLEI